MRKEASEVYGSGHWSAIKREKYSTKSDSIEWAGRKHKENTHLVYLASACIGLSYVFSQTFAVQVVWLGGPLWADFSFSWHWMPNGKGLDCQFVYEGICSYLWWAVTQALIPVSRWVQESSPFIRSQWQAMLPNWKKVRDGNPWCGRQCSTGSQVLESERGYTLALLLARCEVMG